MADTNAFPINSALHPRFVVFNADDFGYSHNINQGIQLAHGGKLLKSASLMATGDAFDEAVSMAKSLEDFEVGVHLCATQTHSCLAGRHLPLLTRGAGCFRMGLAEIGVQLFYSRRLAREILNEWRAQIERILNAGLRPDHLNSHQHVHMHPVLFGHTIELAEQYDIPLVRMPRTNFRLNASLDGSRVVSKFLKAAVFSTLRGCCLAFHDVERSNISLADHAYGLLQIGRTDDKYLVKLLSRVPEGFSEIYMHPGLRPEPCSPHVKRDVELAALLSPSVREAVENEKLTVTTFRRWIDSSETEPEATTAAEPVAVRG